MENFRSKHMMPQQSGFTLIELMVTIGIFGILTSIAIGSWGAMREERRAETAAQEIHSMMIAARLRAMATGKTQYVGVDFAANQVISTMAGGTYDGASWASWAGNWKPYTGVDLISSTALGVVNAAPANRTFMFTNRGTATSASLASKTSATKYYTLTVNGVTGRVRMVQQ